MVSVHFCQNQLAEICCREKIHRDYFISDFNLYPKIKSSGEKCSFIHVYDCNQQLFLSSTNLLVILSFNHSVIKTFENCFSELSLQMSTVQNRLQCSSESESALLYVCVHTYTRSFTSCWIYFTNKPYYAPLH